MRNSRTLLVEMRPILHIHLHPQTSKSLHPRFYLGRADHPERIKQLAQALRSQPTNIQGIADLDAVGAKGLSRPDVFTLDAAQRNRLGGRLAHPVHTQVVITSLVLHAHRLSQFCFPSGAGLHKRVVAHRHFPASSPFRREGVPLIVNYGN